jgi:hypothetical protein
MIQNIIVLLLVALAAVYTVVRLRRLAAGESKCACGTTSCSAASQSCGSGQCNLVSNNEAGGLPVIGTQCGQAGCGRPKA